MRDESWLVRPIHRLDRPSRPNLASGRGEVLKRVDAWEEEVGPTLYGRESGETLYLLSDGTFWNCKVKRAVLSTDHRIALIAELVKIWIVYPNILHKLELPDEACADHERRNTAIDAVLRRAFRQTRSICGSATDYFAPLEAPHRRVTRIHPANL